MSMLKFEVLSPRSIIFKSEVESVTIPAGLGEMCVLPGHASIISTMKYGVITYQKDGKLKKIAVHLGMFYVKNDEVVIMADRGEHADFIDLSRARRAEIAARKKLDELKQQGQEEFDSMTKKYNAKLWRALTRLDLESNLETDN